MTHDCLIVLDTLGTRSTAGILGIHASRFNIDEPTGPAANLTLAISADSNRNAGRTYDGDTLAWWTTRPDAADVFTREGTELDFALADLSAFFEGAESLWIMGRGMEAAILTNAYENFQMEPPWPYWAVRDGRTLCDLACWLNGTQVDVTPRGSTTLETLALRRVALTTAYLSLKGKTERAAA